MPANENGSRSNALLVELLLVIFFFMISAAILVQVFADAKMKSANAKAMNASMLDAQNIAEDLYASEDPDAVLTSYGFAAENGSWVLEKDGYLLKVTLQAEQTETGELRTYEIAGIRDGNTLLALPSARFIPKEVSP